MKNELESKILEEQALKDNAENKLNNLEQEEIEIMKRIRTTTQVHKASKNIFFLNIFNKVVDDYEKMNLNGYGVKSSGGDSAGKGIYLKFFII